MEILCLSYKMALLSQSTDDSHLLNAQDWNKYFQITEVKVCVIMKQLTRLTY